MKKRRIARNILLFLLVPAALIGLIYLFVSLYYTDRFYNGTWINGVNFSNRTVAEAKESLKEYRESYMLRILEPNGDQEVITGAQIDYAAAFDRVDEIKAEFDGVVEAVSAKNGQVVGFGTELFRIRRD